ncbi:ATP-dependent DNA helicase UvrD/PcrA [Staphylococcus aureus]|nr:ATP-dependent DNA helicase UvrD/PcrA [Staphylococcus aureus]
MVRNIKIWQFYIEQMPQSRVLEETFMKSNMPYTMVGGQKFYDRKEIKDLLSYLRIIANSNDDISFATYY